jgi:PRTRC genetic system protein C
MALKRKFIFQGKTLPDPDPGMSPDTVRQMYASQYPELTTAAIVYNDPKEGIQEFSFATKAEKAAAASAGKSIEFRPSIGRKG